MPLLKINKINFITMLSINFLKRQSLISEYFLYNPSQLQKNHLRLYNRFLSQFPIFTSGACTLYYINENNK